MVDGTVIMKNRARIVLATPHRRYDSLESGLRATDRYEVRRLRVREELTVEVLDAFNPSYVIFPHWSWRIPDEIVDRYECVVFHMTDLPFGRGGSPLQNLVVRGIEQTQLSALRCERQIDAGPVYLKMPLSTLGTAEEVFLRAAKLMLPMIVRIIDEGVQPMPQIGEPTAFERRRPAQSDLSQAVTLEQIYDLIRMLDADGYPPAYLDVGPIRLSFSRASLRSESVVADVTIQWRSDIQH